MLLYYRYYGKVLKQEDVREWNSVQPIKHSINKEVV